MSRGAASLLVVAATLAATAAVAAAEHRRYAVIVATATDPDGKLEPLQYADDDGARYHELFAHVADVTRLYTVLDAESQRVFPAVARVAQVPRRADVLAGLDATFAAIDADVAAGHQVTFYFVLIGHGKIGDGGEGHVGLLDGAFTRTDLFQRVLARSRATTNHVIVDACNAYFLVHRRGGGAPDTGPSRRAAVADFVAREDLARYPNTGILLATSTEKETHEWSVYRGGVFSHQLRSALVGGADVNGDGEIAYSEVEAFLAAANQHVLHPDARLEVFAHPPAVDRTRPIVDLRAARFRHWLTIPAGPSLRVYLEDARGVRYADAHVGARTPVVLGLVASAHYHARTADGRRETRLALARERVELDRRSLRPPQVAVRGAVDDSFRTHLFEEPFGVDYYRGFTAARDVAAVDLEAPRWRPGPPDAATVDAALRRLNLLARTDAALRRRLAAAATSLLEAVDAGDHVRALGVLEAAARGASGAER